MLLAFATACAAAPQPILSLDNGTALEVTLVVNGEALAVAMPSGGLEVDAGELGSLPWIVEARAPSGRVLTTMEVQPGDLQHAIGPNGDGSSSGTISHVALSCGLLIVWAGYAPPSVPAAARGAGEPGDCDP